MFQTTNHHPIKDYKSPKPTGTASPPPMGRSWTRWIQSARKPWVRRPCAKVSRMESAISVLLLPFSLDPWNSAESMRTTMALWGKIRFPTLVPYGAPISPCWPHLLTLSRSFNMPTGIPSSFSLSPWAKNSSTPGRKLGQILWLCIWLGWTSTYYWWLGAIISIIRLFHIQLLFVPSFTDYFDVNYRWLGGPNNVYFYPSMGLKCRDKPNDKPTNVKVHQPNH